MFVRISTCDPDESSVVINLRQVCSLRVLKAFTMAYRHGKSYYYHATLRMVDQRSYDLESDEAKRVARLLEGPLPEEEEDSRWAQMKRRDPERMEFGGQTRP